LQLVLRRFWGIQIGTQRSANGSFSLVKEEKTRGVGMTIENKVAFGFEGDDEQPDRSVPESSKTLSC